MRSTITSKGQTVVPAEIRRRFGLSASDALEWVVADGVITVTPVDRDPVAAFRGSGRGGGTARLVAERAADKGRE